MEVSDAVTEHFSLETIVKEEPVYEEEDLSSEFPPSCTTISHGFKIKKEPVNEGETSSSYQLNQVPMVAILKKVLLQHDGKSKNGVSQNVCLKTSLKKEPLDEEVKTTSDFQSSRTSISLGRKIKKEPVNEEVTSSSHQLIPIAKLKKAFQIEDGKAKNMRVIVLRRVPACKTGKTESNLQEDTLSSLAANGISLEITNDSKKSYIIKNTRTVSHGESFSNDALQRDVMLEPCQEMKQEDQLECNQTSIIDLCEDDSDSEGDSCDTPTKKDDTPQPIAICLEGTQKFKCPLCETISSHRTSILRHLNSIHSDKRRYSCDYCPYETNYKTQLKLHVAYKHTNERKHECTLCEYKAVEARNLRRHMMSVHSAEGRIQCPMCDLSTLDNNYLAKHIKIVHLKEKTFKCSECVYVAGFRNHLKYHMMSVHRKEKPHACKLCDYRCSQPWDLKKHHLSRHSSKKPFPCPYCKHASVSCYSLKNHLRVKHSKTL